MDIGYLSIFVFLFVFQGVFSDQLVGTKSTNCTCGEVNKEGQKYPFHGGIFRTNQLICGCTVLTKRHVISSMSCLEFSSGPKSLPKLEIILRDNETDKGQKVGSNNTFRTKIESILRPPGYKTGKLFDNLAILVTKDDISFSDQISPVCLPTGKVDLIGRTLTGIGWGDLASNLYPQHKTADGEDVTVESNEFCNKNEVPITPEMHAFCVNNKTNNACRSVRGGPMVYLDKETNKYFLAGVTTHAKYCKNDWPAQVADVTNFIDWIQQAIASSVPAVKTCSTNA